MDEYSKYKAEFDYSAETNARQGNESSCLKAGATEATAIHSGAPWGQKVEMPESPDINAPKQNKELKAPDGL